VFGVTALLFGAQSAASLATSRAPFIRHVPPSLSLRWPWKWHLQPLSQPRKKAPAQTEKDKQRRLADIQFSLCTSRRQANDLFVGLDARALPPPPSLPPPECIRCLTACGVLSDLQLASSATVSSITADTSDEDRSIACAAAEFVAIALEGMGGAPDESPDLLHHSGYPVSTSVGGGLVEAVAASQ
jgi:hypothetical protein